MSEATKDLLELVSELARRRRKFPHLHASVLAYEMVEKLSADELDRTVAGIKLNRALFLREALTPERRLLHLELIKAVEQFQSDKSDKERRHGISRSHPR